MDAFSILLRKFFFFICTAGLFLVGISSSVYGYQPWTPVEAPSIGTSQYPRAIHFVSPNEGWVVGLGGLLLHYSNNEWTFVDSPSISHLSDYSLTGVHFTSENEGWAVGTDIVRHLGVILHYSNGSWVSVTPPDVDGDWALYGVHFTSPEEGWAVGKSITGGGLLLHYSNGVWTPVTSPYQRRDWELYSVHFTSKNEGWAVGRDRNSTPHSNPAGAVLLHYSNGTWIHLIQPDLTSYRNLYSVHFSSPNEGWAVGVGDNREGAKSNRDGSLQIGMRM